MYSMMRVSLIYNVCLADLLRRVSLTAAVVNTVAPAARLAYTLRIQRSYSAMSGVRGVLVNHSEVNQCQPCWVSLSTIVNDVGSHCQLLSTMLGLIVGILHHSQMCTNLCVEGHTWRVVSTR